MRLSSLHNYPLIQYSRPLIQPPLSFLIFVPYQRLESGHFGRRMPLDMIYDGAKSQLCFWDDFTPLLGRIYSHCTVENSRISAFDMCCLSKWRPEARRQYLWQTATLPSVLYTCGLCPLGIKIVNLAQHAFLIPVAPLCLRPSCF